MKIKNAHSNITLTYWNGYFNRTIKFSEAREIDIHELLDLGYIGEDMIEYDEPKKKAKRYEGVEKAKSKETGNEEQDTPPTEE